jgi:hypothetical protein
MSRTRWVERIVVLTISLVASLEGLRIAMQPKAPWLIYDAIGPGVYLLLLGVGLLIVALFHIAAQRKKNSREEQTTGTPGTQKRLMGMVAALALYVFLIDWMGFAPASFIFFLLEFRAVGMRSWRFNLALSLGLSATCYVVFVEFCSLVFPAGILFG